ncbi:MAG: DUF4136 domain-containing protein [Gammaproteobacteria bacterium]|nr:DUF4136 domain-containing protein [Gammaproteobacteria bacterium]
MTIRSSVPGFAAAAAAMLLLGGCALEARTDSDPRSSVAVCHNYAFADVAASRPDGATAFGNPLNEKRLREAIASSMASHGVPAAAEGVSADCVVGYAIGSRLVPDPTAPRFSWGLGWGGWGYRGMGGSLAWQVPYDYREGRVTVNLYDARSHQALWHAYVDADVTGLTGADAEQRIKAVVDAIFRKFPGGAAGVAAAPATRS